MATRNVVVASPASNQAKRITTSATTWGELKVQSDVAALIVGEVEAIVNPGKLTLNRDESVLPTGDFQLFLISKKNKAGTLSYSQLASEVSEAIRKAAALANEEDVEALKESLIETIADHFGVEAEEIGGGSSDEELNQALKDAKSF